MGIVTDRSAMIFYASGGNSGSVQNIFSVKNNRVGGANAAIGSIAGRAYSLWQADGKDGGGGAVPTVAANPTRSTTGAVGQADPTGGRQLWLTNVSQSWLSQTSVCLLYDRLAHIGGLSGTSTSAQSTALSTTRYTTNAAAYQGNQIWLEIYTQIGATPTTVTASYQDENNSAQTTQAVTFGGTSFREIYRWVQLPLASGTRGVRTVNSVTVLASTGTAGNFGVTIARPIWYCPAGLNTGLNTILRSMLQAPGPQEIMTGACLTWATLSPNTAPEVLISSRLSMIEM